MTQPIQTTAAIAHLRRVADALRDPRYQEPTESFIADLIEHQARRIEAMRAALELARTHIAVDRESFAQCATGPDDLLDPDDNAIVEEYDEALRRIDAAMQEGER